MINKLCLITGANGFLGKALVEYLNKHNVRVRGSIRELNENDDLIDDVFVSGIINDKTIWTDALENVDFIIHTAARVQNLSEHNSDLISEFRDVNTYGTINLAKQAALSGVKRFVFISSIKVNGESTSIDKPFTAADNANPHDSYGISKSEAESLLLELGRKSGMEIVIIRPPLIYGPDVKANFAALIDLVSKGLPLPFACFTTNLRSMVSLENLVSLIITCLEHPNAAGQIFLVSDGHDLSTADIVSKLSKSCGKYNIMIPVPICFLSMVAKIVGKHEFIARLAGSLHVDITKTKTLLNWTPPQSVDDGFKKTAHAFLLSKNK